MSGLVQRSKLAVKTGECLGLQRVITLLRAYLCEQLHSKPVSHYDRWGSLMSPCPVERSLCRPGI